MEKSLAKFEKEQHRLTELYKKGLVEIDDIEKEMLGIKEQKKAIIENIMEKKASQGVVKVSDDEIKHAIDHLAEEMRLADGNAQKMAFQALFDEVKLHPKEGQPWSRKIELKRVQLPLRGVKLASPRGFEPLSPA